MDGEVGVEFVRALAAKDADRLLAILRSDVEFRGLTPRKFWEADTAEELVHDIILGQWFEEHDHVDGIEAIECSELPQRNRVGYRLRVTNPDGTFAVEQQAYYSGDNGEIDWLRIMCAGYQPIAED